MEKVMFCLHCVNFNLRDYPAHVRVGFGRCMAANLYSQGAVFMPIRTVHECDKYDPVKDDVLIKRKEWNESRKGR